MNSINNSILRRLKALENAPQSQIPKLRVEFEDGHTETVYGFSVLAYQEGVRSVVFNGQHQPSVDTAALYGALNPDVDISTEN